VLSRGSGLRAALSGSPLKDGLQSPRLRSDGPTCIIELALILQRVAGSARLLVTRCSSLPRPDQGFLCGLRKTLKNHSSSTANEMKTLIYPGASGHNLITRLFPFPWDPQMARTVLRFIIAIQRASTMADGAFCGAWRERVWPRAPARERSGETHVASTVLPRGSGCPASAARWFPRAPKLAGLGTGRGGLWPGKCRPGGASPLASSQPLPAVSGALRRTRAAALCGTLHTRARPSPSALHCSGAVAERGFCCALWQAALAEKAATEAQEKIDAQALPIRTYLDQTVVPILLQGLSDLVKQRCCDPPTLRMLACLLSIQLWDNWRLHSPR